MARWKSNTRVRLEQAAIELYLERGFEATTVAEIAERVGLTERTFFRHFADKREVLFDGSHLFQTLIADAVAAAPQSASALEAVIVGVEAASIVFQGSAERSRLRQNIIDATPELQARDLSKMSALALALAQTLRQRGVPDPAASLAAETGIVILRSAFERWITPVNQHSWPQLVREALGELRAVVGGAEEVRKKAD
ncbi:TetR family transcriptional regulator [Deinococcus sp.]|uniref:TetR family transcriptional regulator n=1 Tax=Deinococcus sp. TaxID=47478 RepID=UPI003B59155A